MPWGQGSSLAGGCCECGQGEVAGKNVSCAQKRWLRKWAPSCVPAWALSRREGRSPHPARGRTTHTVQRAAGQPFPPTSNGRGRSQDGKQEEGLVEAVRGGGPARGWAPAPGVARPAAHRRARRQQETAIHAIRRSLLRQGTPNRSARGLLALGAHLGSHRVLCVTVIRIEKWVSKRLVWPQEVLGARKQSNSMSLRDQ